MKYSTFLIKYAEIAIKGKNRYVFEDALMHRIKLAMKHVDGDFSVSKTQGRMFVDCNSDYDFDEVIAALGRVFGINAICPVVKTAKTDFEKLCADVVEYVGKEYPEQRGTFKVFARRADKSFPVHSTEMNCELGAAILDAYPQMKVDVHKPDTIIYVEVREKCFVYTFFCSAEHINNEAVRRDIGS